MRFAEMECRLFLSFHTGTLGSRRTGFDNKILEEKHEKKLNKKFSCRGALPGAGDSAAAGIPCFRGRQYFFTDAHSRAAVRPALRLAVWSAVRIYRAASVLAFYRDAADFPNCAGNDAGTVRLGALTGLLYRKIKWNVYFSLISSMLAGRVVSGVANAVFLGIAGKAYGFSAFLTASFVTAIPGIIIQLVAVPLVVICLEKAGLMESPRKQAYAAV